ncbi:MAG: site-specific DNA-methyltransferase, partial [Chloroflexota bacterium]|nr:site-specific DNA-methyltransferase [Chloroflexota bacterium]
DFGFRVFQLAPSNFKAWEEPQHKDQARYVRSLRAAIDTLGESFDVQNAIWEVAIKEGFGLTTEIEKVPSIKSNEVYLVKDPDLGQSFRICLDKTLRAQSVAAMSLTRDDLFVCRDVAITDEIAANLALQCRLKTL